MRFSQWSAMTLFGLSLLYLAPASAQEPDVSALEQGLSLDDERALLAEKLIFEDLADLPTDSFDEELWAMAVRDALAREKNVRARELTEQILRKNPDSFVGHCLMGIVYHRAEGNLPRAYFHMSRSRELFEQRFSPWPADSDPWPWHAQSIVGMAMIAGEMGRHEEKIRLLLEHDEIYSPPTTADRGWPLMRLRRYDEARAAVTEALLMDDPNQVAHALTARCAIEAELQDREASYSACKDAAEHERAHSMPGPTPFTNAGEASLGMLLFDAAEAYILEGSKHFVRGTVSNPWLDLTLLYMAQGRTAEALDAVRSMFQWRRRQPPFMDEQNRAETEMTSAIFLLVAGHPLEAARITRRAMARPDRTGFTSSESEQLEAASALVDAVVNRVAAEMVLEEAPTLDWRPRLAAYAKAWQLQLRSWASGRRAASLLADGRFLLATLQPYLAGGIELPEWLKIELVPLLGAGVTEIALEQVAEKESLSAAAAYFKAYGAEAAYLSGRYESTLARVDQALETLPGAEVLLRARVAARGAQAALALGRQNEGLDLLDRALQTDPGVVRRVGLALPVRLEVDDSAGARIAADTLADSPRFQKSNRGATFTLRVTGDSRSVETCLMGPKGTRVSCKRATMRVGEQILDLGRRAARELQVEAFAPRLDLTQADLRSLDGSPTAAGGRSHEKLNQVLRDVTSEN